MKTHFRILMTVVAASLFLASGASMPASGETLTYTNHTGPRMFFSPISVDFGPVGLNLTSPQQIVTITNTGSVTLTNFAGGATSAPFGASQNCAGGVAPGASCQFFYAFTPTSVGSFSATSNISTNAGSIQVAMRGQGVGPQAQVSSTSLDFGFVPSGSTSAQQVVTIRNTGKSTLTNFAGGATGAPFSASQNCAGGVAPGASCQFNYSFAPASEGNFSASSNISTNAGAIQITMVGTSVPLASGPHAFYTPHDLDFGPTGTGTASAQKTVTITNQGNATLTNFAGGAPGTPFNASQNCASGVAPGASCQYFFTFNPGAAGAASATSNSSTNGGSIIVSLRGTGVGADRFYTPLSIDFGPVATGTSGTQQVVTITNTGLATLTNFAGGAPGAPFTASQNCAGGVAPGASCQYFFNFVPTRSGRFHNVSSTSTNAGTIQIDLWGGELLKTYLPAIRK